MRKCWLEWFTTHCRGWWSQISSLALPPRRPSPSACLFCTSTCFRLPHFCSERLTAISLCWAANLQPSSLQSILWFLFVPISNLLSISLVKPSPWPASLLLCCFVSSFFSFVLFCFISHQLPCVCLEAFTLIEVWTVYAVDVACLTEQIHLN